jgi:hypothetical protein
MPISPSDLPWWGWLLCSFGAWGTCWVMAFLNEDSDSGGFLLVLTAIVSGLAGLLTGIMGVVLFVKWIWNS